MLAGDTFVLSSKVIEGGHPKIVISDPHEGRVVTVSLSEWFDNKDQSCILEDGDEIIVTKKSIVSYRDASVISVSKLDECLQSGEIIATEPVSADTIEKILYGCSITRFIKQGPFDLLNELGLIPVV